MSNANCMFDQTKPTYAIYVLYSGHWHLFRDQDLIEFLNF